MKAAIPSSAILIALVFLSFVQCEKKFLKGKHGNKTSSAAKTKNGKRWMQTYPLGYMQQQESIQSTAFNNPYGEQPFGGSPDTLGYSFNGFKDSSFHDIYNLNKQSYGGEDLSSNFAQDENAYLKPGIGDYPSDIQINPFNNLGNLRTGSYDMMNNIGLPIHEKPKTQKLSQALNTLEQIALDDAALNPSALHKTPTSNLLSTDTTNLNKADSNGATGKLAQEPLPLVKDSEAATESVAAVEAKDDGKTAELLPKVEAKEDTTDEPTADKLKETAKQKGEITLQKVSNLSKDSNKEVAGENSSKDKDGSKVEKEVASVVSSKAKTQNGARRQSWESELADISDIGLPSFTSNGVYDKEVLENSDLAEDVEKTPYKVKEKLISSLQKALSGKEMSADENKELEDAGKNMALEKGESSIELVEDSTSEEKEASGKPELSDADGKSEADSKTAIIEQNLMKIDKPKLVHLLATFIRDNEMKEEDGQNEIKEDVKSKHLAQKSKNENLQESKENFDLKVLATKLQNAEKSLNDAEKVKVKGIKGQKHGEHGSSLEHDPYANIGNTDPLNADTDPSIGTRKTKKPVHRFSSNEEEDLSKAKEASDKEEEQDEKRKAAEALKLEKQLKEEKDALKEKAAEMKEAKLTHTKNKQDSESSGDLKEGKETEQENVDVEVQLERQELKKLKALEKAEKEKEIELKTSFMVNKNKGNEAAEEESNEEETNVNDDVNKKASKSQKVRLVSPELVKAIADQLEKHKSENDQELSQESENSKEESKIDGKEESKESEESTDHDKESEKLKEDEKVDDDSLNVQTLIEHMKQSLINAKKFKNKNALKQAEKPSKHHKSTYDDAYAQIGSQDINVKRSRKFAKKSLTRISSRDKKHHVHHTHPLKKH